VREAPRQNKEESVAVTGLNLEHARALQADSSYSLQEEDAQLVVWSARQVRVIKKHEKRPGVIFCEYVARSKNSGKAALLGYCGLGTAINLKMSAILLGDKNLELLRCLP
jgi:hypothetical protein